MKSGSIFALILSITLGVASSPAHVSAGTPFVPGTGTFLADCSDDFEDTSWGYKYHLPKSSHEQDERQRSPGGRSSNRLWHEGGKRGTPDLVKRVTTPPGGLEGSTASLQMATKNSGIPGRPSRKQQQDDLLLKFDRKLGRSIHVSWQPSCTVRVYLPPFEQWENRSGASFGMRADCQGRDNSGESEPYWPGMFFLFRSETSRKVESDSAKLTIRAGRRGNDIRSHDITEPGWWTLGMSFSPDGQIHYYAKPGVEDLTAEDYLVSNYPYGLRCQTFNNFFFNVANWDNGRTWSTPWVIDDPKIFVIPPPGKQVAQLYRTKGKRSKNSRMSRKSSSRSSSKASSKNRRSRR